MNFKDRIEQFQTRIEKSPRRSYGSLYLAILTPVVFNSLATVGITKYFSTQSTNKNINSLVDNYTNNISDRLLLRLNSSVTAADAKSEEFSIKLFEQMLDEYLANLNVSYSSYVAIINQDGSIIASNLKDSAANSVVSRQDISAYLLQQRNLLFEIDRPQKISFKFKQQQFLGQVIPWQKQELGSNWLVVIVPQSELLIDSLARQNNFIAQYSIYLLPVIPLWFLTSIWTAWSIINSNRSTDNRAIDDGAIANVARIEEQNLSSSLEDDLVIENDNTADYEPYMLLADMSHELRSPLNAILGFAQIMEQELSTTPGNQENLAIIHRNGEHLLSIINDIVDLAKIETHRLALERNQINFHNWLDNIEQILEFQVGDRGGKFSLIRQDNLPSGICLDERRLRQILSNLIDYCLIESTPTTEVSLRVTSSHLSEIVAQASQPKIKRHNICFEIANHDFSITATELATLFDSKASVRQAQKSAGSSLNLPISRKLAQLMGGNISVSNDANLKQGIIFNLEIEAESAVVRESPLQPTLRRVIGLESDRTDYRILIVDDSKTNRKIMSNLLEPVGFVVKEAVNGKEAVDIWLSWQPHMIWMDLRMPVMNGYEATKRIKSYSATLNTPIVALSATTLEEEKSLFKAAGCDDFVGKPCSENIIFAKIAQHLGIRYVYQADSPISLNHFKLTADRLQVMPSQWIDRLELAAEMLDRDSLTQLLQEIPSKHADLKHALQKRISNFDFDEILSLVKSSDNK